MQPRANVKTSGEHPKPETPTAKMMIAMDGAYRYFSEALFAPVLGATPPPPIVSLSRGKTQRVLGFFVPDYWSDGSEAFGWIAITPEAIVRANLRDAMATLVHEMTHALDHAQTVTKGKKPSPGGYHPKSWFDLMEKLGVPGCANNKAKIAVGHEVIEGGPFDVAFRAMPPSCSCHSSRPARRTPSRRSRRSRASDTGTNARLAKRRCAGLPGRRLCVSTAACSTSRTAPRRTRWQHDRPSPTLRHHARLP
jgi:hypothetical protein